MIIDKPFWYKETTTGRHAFSYDNPSNVKKFAKQYGGIALPSLEVSMEIASNIKEDLELCSVLVNTGPIQQQNLDKIDPKRYKVLVKQNGEFVEYDAGHSSLREANTVAKAITKSYETVLVMRKVILSVEGMEVEETEIPSVGVMG